MAVPKISILALCACLLFSATALAKKESKAELPDAYQKLIACRAVADEKERLACYDTQTGALAEAQQKNEVVIVDKTEVKKARRGLFGLALPDLGGIFGGDDKEGELTAIESSISDLAKDANGKWIFTIEDGARWAQTESSGMRTPKIGQKIRIRKASLGSFFANVNGEPAIRVKRVN